MAARTEGQEARGPAARESIARRQHVSSKDLPTAESLNRRIWSRRTRHSRGETSPQKNGSAPRPWTLPGNVTFPGSGGIVGSEYQYSLLLLGWLRERKRKGGRTLELLAVRPHAPARDGLPVRELRARFLRLGQPGDLCPLAVERLAEQRKVDRAWVLWPPLVRRRRGRDVERDELDVDARRQRDEDVAPARRAASARLRARVDEPGRSELTSRRRRACRRGRW